MFKTKTKNWNASPVTPERMIQNSILRLLQIYENQGRLYFYRTGAGAVPVARQGGETGLFKTGRPGCPDITIVLYGSVYLGMEVKTIKGTLSDPQKKTESYLHKIDSNYEVVHSVEEAQEVLQRYIIKYSPPEGKIRPWYEKKDQA